MLTVGLMFVFGVVALALLGLGIYEAVTHHKGHPSPRLNWIRPLIGPLALAIITIWFFLKANDRRKLACSRGQK